MRDGNRLSVAVSNGAFVLVGVSAGVGGVLLPAQMTDYGVDRAKIGITFFVFSAGFMLAGSAVGWLIHRFGMRTTLAAGTALFALSSLYTAIRPAFAGLLIVQLFLGCGIGVVESGLNTHLARLPHAAQRVNRLHAFFGVGALLGPLLATWMLRSWPWQRVWLVIALANAVLLAGVLLLVPKAGWSVSEHEADPVQRTSLPAEPELTPAPEPEPQTRPDGRGLLAAAVREPAVMLAAVFLAVYVGLEIGVGNWAFGFLVSGRGQSQLLAGYALSGYWLGLTAGRFVISPAALRAGLSEIGVSFLCLGGVLASCGLLWLSSGPAAAVSLALLGFFLGPLFPTAMAITPRLAEPRVVPSAIGFINGVSVIGGSVLPWLAGVLAQSGGTGTLLPFSAVLAALLVVLWWRLARHVTQVREPESVLDHA